MPYQITASFPDAASTAITSTTTDQGQAWVRPAGGSTGPYITDGAGGLTDSWGSGAFAVVNATLPDANHYVKRSVNSGNCGVLLGCDKDAASQTTYKAFWHTGAGGWVIQKVVANVGAYLFGGAQASAYTPIGGGNTRVIKLRRTIVSGNALLELLIDEVVRISGTDSSSPMITPGYGGVYGTGLGLFEIYGAGGPAPAVLSSAGSASITSSTVSATCTSDTAGGTLHAVATSTNSQPSNAQIKAGSGATIVSHGSVTAVSGANAVPVTGLSASTTYYLWFLQDTGADSNVPSSVSFTTSAAGTPPVITSNGGGATASISVAENTTAITTGTATAGSSGATVWSVNGTDASFISVNSSSGVCTFTVAPNYEAPGDAGTNNTYVFNLRATAPDATYDEQTITVTVTDDTGEASPPAAHRVLMIG